LATDKKYDLPDTTLVRGEERERENDLSDGPALLGASELIDRRSRKIDSGKPAVNSKTQNKTA
jgi:hypothetical protein